MKAPTTNLAACYFTAALVNFLGSLILDGITIALGLEQGFFQLWLSFFTVCFLYLALFYLGTDVGSAWFDQVLFAILLFMLVLLFCGADRLLMPLGLVISALLGWLLVRSADLAFRTGLAGIVALGAYLATNGLTGGTKLLPGQVLLDGASMLLWLSAYCWYLADSGRVKKAQARQALRQLIAVAVVGGLIWWFKPQLAPLIRAAAVIPLLALWGDSYLHRADEFWEMLLLGLVCVGLLAAPASPLFRRTLIWPLYIIGLILIPRRYRRRLLGLAPLAGNLPGDLWLKIGATLFFGGLWAGATPIILIGNAIFLCSYLRFLQELFSLREQEFSPTEFTGEAHIIQGF